MHPGQSSSLARTCKCLQCRSVMQYRAGSSATRSVKQHSAHLHELVMEVALLLHKLPSDLLQLSLQHPPTHPLGTYPMCMHMQAHLTLACFIPYPESTKPIPYLDTPSTCTRCRARQLLPQQAQLIPPPSSDNWQQFKAEYCCSRMGRTSP